MGVIVAQLTGKPLAYGVRNSKCKSCDEGKTIPCNCIPPEADPDEEVMWLDYCEQRDKHHHCYKNWTKSATSMEQDIVAEGFCSITSAGPDVMPCLLCFQNSGLEVSCTDCPDPEHADQQFTKPGTQQPLERRVLINSYTGDGDSGVINCINTQYRWCRVQKVEDVNHCVKACSNKLFAAVKEKHSLGTKAGSGEMHLSNNRIKMIVSYIRKAIEYNGKQGKSAQHVENLKRDMQNVWTHLKGDHSKCRLNAMCGKAGRTDGVKTCSEALDKVVQEAVYSVVCRAPQLIELGCSNQSESVFSVCASLTGGKHKNMVTRHMWTARARLAVLKFSEGAKFKQHLLSFLCNEEQHHWHVKISREEVRRDRAREARISEEGKKRRKTLKMQRADKSDSNKQGGEAAYFSAADRLDEPTSDDLRHKCTEHFNKHFRQAQDTLKEIAISQGQRTSDWHEQRSKRITGSCAGKVLKSQLNPRADRGKLVQDITAPPRTFSTKSLQAGLQREPVTVNECKWLVEEFFAPQDTKLHEVGLRVCQEHQFLASSVDGILHMNGSCCLMCSSISGVCTCTCMPCGASRH